MKPDASTSMKIAPTIKIARKKVVNLVIRRCHVSFTSLGNANAEKSANSSMKTAKMKVVSHLVVIWAILIEISEQAKKQIPYPSAVYLKKD